MVKPEAARQQIDLRLRELRARSFVELKSLAPVRVEVIPFGTELWSLTTYRDLEKDGLRIVVQIGPPQRKFVLVQVQADGFRIGADGCISALTDRDLYEFT